MSPSGEYLPHICIVCDEFVFPSNLRMISSEVLVQSRHLLTPTLTSTWNVVPPAIHQCYTYVGEIGTEDTNGELRSSLDELLLSPRACFVSNADGRVEDGFSVCSRCKRSLARNERDAKIALPSPITIASVVHQNAYCSCRK